MYSISLKFLALKVKNLIISFFIEKKLLFKIEMPVKLPIKWKTTKFI